MQTNQRKTMEVARIELNQMLADLAQKEITKILNTVDKKLDNHHCQQRQVYASMDPIDIINDLVEICRELCQGRYT